MEKELIDGVEDMGAISDINVTPFIDIMLVLLIIFMVTAPLMLGGVHVNLPKAGGDPMPRPENPTIVSLDANSRIYLDKEELPTSGYQTRFQRLARESATGEVFVRGDGEVKYGRMMELMAELGQAGFARVTLVTDIRLGPQSTNQAPGQTTPPASGQPETQVPASEPPAAQETPIGHGGTVRP